MIDKIQEILSRDVILGNATIDWLRAFIIFSTLFFIASIMKIYGSKKYKALKENNKSKISAGFVISSFLRKLNFFVVVICSVYVSLASLEISARVHSVSKKIFIIAAFIQVLIWVMNAINLYSRGYIYARLEKDPTSVTAANVFTLIAKISAFFVVLLLALDQMGFNISTLLAGLGVGGIAVALAVQNILGDVFASLTIVLDKPFKVGDTLLINNEWGTIEKVGLKNTRVRSINGNLLIIPNNYLLQNNIQNFSELKERRTLFTVGVLYETPYEKLQTIPDLVKQAVSIHKNNRLDRVTFNEFQDSALGFEVSYYTKEDSNTKLFDVRHAVNMEIVKLFNEKQIGFAYPTRTLYINNSSKTE